MFYILFEVRMQYLLKRIRGYHNIAEGYGIGWPHVVSESGDTRSSSGFLPCWAEDRGWGNWRAGLLYAVIALITDGAMMR